MQTRQLEFTDLHLTTIGFGAWAVGWALTAEDIAEIDAALASREASLAG